MWVRSENFPLPWGHVVAVAGLHKFRGCPMVQPRMRGRNYTASNCCKRVKYFSQPRHGCPQLWRRYNVDHAPTSKILLREIKHEQDRLVTFLEMLWLMF